MMISLWDIFKKLWSTTKINAHANDESQLLHLPTEIILLIACELPISSTACLTLTSRRLSQILGPGFWQSLKSEAPDVFLEFLILLEKDLPGHFLCQQCIRFHRIDVIQWPRIVTYRFNRPRCTRHWQREEYQVLPLSRYRIHFAHIHLAMRQHHCGTDIGFPLEAFQHLEVHYNENQQQTTLSSIDAQIVSNELLVRSQAWVLVPWSQYNQFFQELVSRGTFSYSICIHMRRGPKFKEDSVVDLMRCKVDKRKALEECFTETFQCQSCQADYELDARDFGERGFAVIVTKWANLGAGLDFSDPHWKCHVISPLPKGFYNPHSRGSIRASFERVTEVTVEKLTADNESKLFSKRTRWPRTRGKDGCVWNLRGDWWYLAPCGIPEKTFWETLTSDTYYL